MFFHSQQNRRQAILPYPRQPKCIEDFNLTPHNHNIRVKFVIRISEYMQKVSGLKIVSSKTTSLPVVKIADVLTRNHLSSHYRIPALEYPQCISTVTLVPLDFNDVKRPHFDRRHIQSTPLKYQAQRVEQRTTYLPTYLTN